MLKRAHELAPERLSPTATLAQFSLHSENYAAAEWLAELRRHGYNIEAAWIQGEEAILRADPNAAMHWFEIVRNSPSPVRAIAGYHLLAHVDAEVGNIAQAQQLLSNAIQLAGSQGDTGDQGVLLMDRAWLHCQLDQIADCARDAEHSLSFDRSPQSLRASSLLVIRFGSTSSRDEQSLFVNLLGHIGRDSGTDEVGPLFDMAELEREGALQLMHRNCGAALKAFRAEAAIDAPVDSREYLAIALEQCAKWERTPEQARSLRRDAADAYARAAFTPALVWDMIQFHPPGLMPINSVDGCELPTNVDSAIPMRASSCCSSDPLISLAVSRTRDVRKRYRNSPTNRKRKEQKFMDNPAIRNLMLLWLVVTTEMGNNGGAYFTQLANNANNEQAALAKQLNLSAGTVTQVIKTVSANLAQFQTIAGQFHAQAKLTFPVEYDGPFCPASADTVLSLVPAALGANTKASK